MGSLSSVRCNLDGPEVMLVGRCDGDVRVTEGGEDSLSDWSSPIAAGRSGVAVCTSTWKIVDVLSGDESTYAACQSASVRPQPDRTYYSTSNRLAVYFVGQMRSSGVVQSTTAAITAHDDQQQQQQRHSERLEDAPLQLLHYTGQSPTLLQRILTCKLMSNTAG